MNFKSAGGYKKWLAYGHMHGDFEKTPGNQPVSIKGKSHKVNHSKSFSKTAVKRSIDKDKDTD